MAFRKTISRLGRYRVLGRIATGGMATVYRARLHGAGGFVREVALKVVHPHLAQVPGFGERFLDEARIASRVRHPNCVATIDVGEDQGYRFLVLELIDGLTLRQLALHREHPLAPDEAARVVADAARGLHAVHESEDEGGAQLDVIHRDLSPHNLMLDVRGRTVLIDLGLAKARGQLGHTQTGVLAGRLPYMSPEQSRLDPLDARSDVFSLGAVLHELVTGRLPFGEDHTPGTLERLRACDRGAIMRGLERDGVPEWSSEIILACLHADPGQRFASARALAEAIDQELHRHGREEGEIRRRLALYAADGKRALGPDAPADELVPGIAHAPAPARGRGRKRLALAAAVGVVLAVGVWRWQALEGAAARPDPERSAPSLASDQAPQVAPPRGSTRPDRVELAREPPTSTPVSDGGASAPTDTPPPDAPERRRPPKRPPKLKSNPYTP